MGTFMVWKINVPTLLAWTDHDPISTVEEGRPRQDMILGSEFTVIKDAEHCQQREKPEEFNELLTNFSSENSKKVAIK